MMPPEERGNVFDNDDLAFNDTWRTILRDLAFRAEEGGGVEDPPKIDDAETMACSAALGYTGACYIDTTGGDAQRELTNDAQRGPTNDGARELSESGVVVHPLFAVCVKWPVIVAGRDRAHKWGITPDETQRSVHASGHIPRCSRSATRTPKPRRHRVISLTMLASVVRRGPFDTRWHAAARDG